MSEAGQEKKITAIMHPAEFRALMRVGMKLSNGYGQTKTQLVRDAIRAYIAMNNEPIVYPKEVAHDDDT